MKGWISLMPVTEILVRSISGYIFVFPGVIVYFALLKRLGKKQTMFHIGGAFVFAYYLIGILTMTGIGKLKDFSPTFVFLPLLYKINGWTETILNIILFVPLGFFIPLLYKRYAHFLKVVWVGVLISLAIELVQMFGMGATDINDLLTNTMGTCVGYVAYRLFFKLLGEKKTSGFFADRLHDKMEVLFLVSYVFLVMMTLQSYLIGTLFGLG